MSLNSVILISIRIKQKMYSKTLIQLSNSSILQSILTFLISFPIQNNFSRTPSTPTFSPPNLNFQSFNRSSSPKSTIKHEKNIWAEQTRFALLCRRIANILIEAVFPELSNHATLLPPPSPQFLAVVICTLNYPHCCRDRARTQSIHNGRFRLFADPCPAAKGGGHVGGIRGWNRRHRSPHRPRDRNGLCINHFQPPPIPRFNTLRTFFLLSMQGSFYITSLKHVEWK